MGRCTGRDRGFTLVELLAVTAIVSLLAAILVPALSRVRAAARSSACLSNLHQVGALIHAFANAHDDSPAPVLRDVDARWDDRPGLGWDVQTGLWAHVPGGERTIWRCAEQGTPFVGNARALGVDNGRRFPGGRRYLVPRSRWSSPSRLVLAYDLQYNLLDNIYRHARDPLSGDLSDEMYYPWPRGEYDVTVELYLDRWGPHAERYAALFADGRATLGLFSSAAQAVLWSGPKWWSDDEAEARRAARLP